MCVCVFTNSLTAKWERKERFLTLSNKKLWFIKMLSISAVRSFIWWLFSKAIEEEKEWKKWISEYVEHRTYTLQSMEIFIEIHEFFINLFFASYWRFILCKKRLLRECPVVCEAIQWDIHREIFINKSKAFASLKFSLKRFAWMNLSTAPWLFWFLLWQRNFPFM